MKVLTYEGCARCHALAVDRGGRRTLTHAPGCQNVSSGFIRAPHAVDSAETESGRDNNYERAERAAGALDAYWGMDGAEDARACIKDLLGDLMHLWDRVDIPEGEDREPFFTAIDVAEDMYRVEVKEDSAGCGAPFYLLPDSMEASDAARFELSSDRDDWLDLSDPTTPDARDDLLYLLGGLTINGCGFVAHAWRIRSTDEDGIQDVAQEAVEIYSAVGADGTWQTIKIGGERYALTITPQC